MVDLAERVNQLLQVLPGTKHLEHIPGDDEFFALNLSKASVLYKKELTKKKNNIATGSTIRIRLATCEYGLAWNSFHKEEYDHAFDHLAEDLKLLKEAGVQKRNIVKNYISAMEGLISEGNNYEGLFIVEFLLDYMNLSFSEEEMLKQSFAYQVKISNAKNPAKAQVLVNAGYDLFPDLEEIIAPEDIEPQMISPEVDPLAYLSRHKYSLVYKTLSPEGISGLSKYLLQSYREGEGIYAPQPLYSLEELQFLTLPFIAECCASPVGQGKYSLSIMNSSPIN